MTGTGSPPIRIDALDDPRVEVFRNVRDRDLRDAHGGLFMAESERVIRRLLASDLSVHSILLTPTRHRALAGALAARAETAAGAPPVLVAEPELMDEIVGFPIHRGALAAGVRPADRSIETVFGHLRGDGRCRLLLAHGITNVDNMGALFRNAACFGLDGVIIDDRCCDPLYRKALRVSVGHAITVPHAVAGDWTAALEQLRDRWGVTLLAAEVAADAIPADRMPRPDRVGLVLGSEDAGLGAATLDRCDHVVAVPMAAGADSLNVAVASALLLYEMQRGG